MDVFMLLREGAPISYFVVLAGLFAIGCAVAQVVARTRDLSGLVSGGLALQLALIALGVAYGLSMLASMSDADAPSKAILIARGGTIAVVACQTGGVLGVIASVLAGTAAVRAPQDRALGAMRAVSFAVAFGACAMIAISIRSAVGTIVVADEAARGTLLLVTLGSAFGRGLLGFGLCALLAFVTAMLGIRSTAPSV